MTKVRLEREMEEGTGWLKLLPKESGREGGLLAVLSKDMVRGREGGDWVIEESAESEGSKKGWERGLIE